jgi:hypothetical protein
MLHDAVSFVNVVQRTVFQSWRERIVFFAVDIVVSLIQQFERAMVAVLLVQSRVRSRAHRAGPLRFDLHHKLLPIYNRGRPQLL